MKTMTPTRPALPACRKNRSWAFTLIELLVVISIIAILASIAVPTFQTVLLRAAQARDLSNARQVALGLRLFASDSNGAYPTTDPAGNPLNASNGSNGAFANLVPQYIPQERIFFLPKSAWCTRNGSIQPPDEVTTSGTNWSSSGPGSLSKGENSFAYVTNLNDTSNPSYPLIADGFSATAGTYASNQAVPGGVWFGRGAIVVRADGSGTIEKCNGQYQVMGVTPDSPNANIFSSSANWLTSSQVLNPL